MDEDRSSDRPPSTSRPEERLDSWKAIAAYLQRDVTTVQRWEKRERMPVHRHLHDKLGSVYALRGELDAWVQSRTPPIVHAKEETSSAVLPVGASRATASGRARRWVVWELLAGGVMLLAIVGWRLDRADTFWRNPIANATFQPITDFEGTQQAAAVSRDGTSIAFISNRGGRSDVWMTHIGAGQFYNLTRGSAPDLVNPAVRTLEFSPDGNLVYFWARQSNGSKPGDIGILSVSVHGGPPRPYLDDAAELDWSSDGSRLVYHTPGPGDPMFVTEAHQPPPGRQIFVAAAGRHAHFPTWSTDGAFIYFVGGVVPDGMDIWRIQPVAGAAERVTFQNSRVTYPVFVDDRTLLYLATDADGSGPWLYTVDVNRRVPHRLESGVDRYESLAISADRRRLVATLTNPKTTFWRLPLADAPVDTSTASRIPLTTTSGRSPRLGPGYLLYVSTQSAGDSLWKVADNAAAAVWSEPGARIIGGPTISADGAHIAVLIQVKGRPRLYVMNSDGAAARVVSDSTALRGDPAWAPDGRSLLMSVDDRGVPRLCAITVDGASVTPLVSEYSVEPLWDPDGRFIVFSGPDIGTTFRVKAVSADGSAYRIPNLSLTRGARRVRFLPGRRALVVMKGELDRKDVWLIDLETGTERQLTEFGRDFVIRDFDVSPDGRSLVVEQVQDHSDIVRLDLPNR